ncbi:MAG: phosphoadenylyl-sulfate reductase [Balneola sp.]
MSIAENVSYSESVKEITNDIKELIAANKKLFLTSSLQTHSIPLLHLVDSIDSEIPIFFLDTGYHFSETMHFKEMLKREFKFNIIELTSPIDRINQRDLDGKLMYASDPDYCCYMNKVLPLEPVLKEFDIWISGVRKSQSSFRSELKKFENGKFNSQRYHPILYWTSKMIFDYRKDFDLPAHPLEEKGYFSVGCMPCTRVQNIDGDPRESRWFGMNKTECGLQTDTLEN